MMIDGKTKANNNPQKELLLAFEYLMAEADRLSAALVVPDVSGREIHPTIVIHLEHVHTILVETFALSDFFHHPFHLFTFLIVKHFSSVFSFFHCREHLHPRCCYPLFLSLPMQR